MKFLQKQRERKSGIPAIPSVQTGGIVAKVTEKGEADGEKEELVLQDTFAQETAVLVEDPNMYALFYPLPFFVCFLQEIA